MTTAPRRAGLRLPRNRRFLDVVAAVGLAWAAACGVAFLLAFIPGTGRGMNALLPGFIVPVFAFWLIVIAVMLAGTEAGERPDGTYMVWVFGWAPQWLRRLAVTVFAAAIVSFIAAMVQIPGGAPTDDAGRHYLDNHGVQTPISATQYEAALRVQDRIAVGHSAAFYTVGAAFLAGMRRRPVAVRTDSAGRDDPSRRR